MAGTARSAGLKRIGDLADRVQTQFCNLTAKIGLGQREALANDTAFFLLVGVDIHSEFA